MTGKPDLPATEGVDPRYRDLDLWETRTAVTALWEGQLAAVAAVGAVVNQIAAAADAAARQLRQGNGRIAYGGAGTSGRLGVLDAAELIPTFDWPPERILLLMAGGPAALIEAVEGAEDDAADGADKVGRHRIGAEDVVVALAASGVTPYAVALARAARDRGALTIGVTNSPGSALAEVVDHPLVVATGAEAPAGSTRMKAGTAQKVVLNLFSTTVMIRMGRVYQGMMIDLVPRNEKLRHRTRRMLADLTGGGPEEVERALAEASGNVKTAVLVALGLDAADARERLRHADGNLRQALLALGRGAGRGCQP